MPVKISNNKTAFSQNIIDSKATNATQKWWNKDIQLWSKGISTDERESLYSELSNLLTAGLDIQRSLVLIESSRKKGKLKVVIQDIRNNIIEGLILSQALKKTGYFSDYEVYTIKIGEETGKLNAVLLELSKFYQKSAKFRQRLIGALAYPVFVIGFSLLVVWFLLKFLVPLFSDIYKRFDGELPSITQHIISVSNWVGEYGGLICILILGLIAFFISQKQKMWCRKFFSSITLKIPLFGKIIKQIYLARFCQSLGFLLESKVPLNQAVTLIQQMIGFYPVEQSMKNTQTEITNGTPLYESLSKSTFYPERLIALTKVGEETGKIDQMFFQLAAYYSSQADEKTALIGSLIEPVLIISLGVIVGIILIAMYLPLFQMSTGFL